MNYDALRPGFLLRDFPLPGHEGQLLSELRGTHAMILLFGAPLAPLARAAGERIAVFDENETRLLLVLRGRSGPLALPFPLLHDDGSVAAALARQNEGREPEWFACATDRFGEIFFAASGAAGDALPTLAELEQWAVFVNTHCPECHPPEWPPL
jgi:hypothetical protein